MAPRTTTTTEQFTLTLRPLPGWDVPAIIRLRKFLKMALRSYGLRCVEIRPAEAGGTTSDKIAVSVVSEGMTEVSGQVLPEVPNG